MSSTAGRLFPLPVLGESQIRELVSDISLHLEITREYKKATQEQAAAMPAYPSTVSPSGAVVRTEGATQHVIRFGYVQPPRRLPQLWIQSYSMQAGAMTPNPDGDSQALDPTMRPILSERSKIFAKLRLSDLETRTVVLSYVDAEAALFALRAMGYSAITDSESLAKEDSYKGEEVLLDPAAAGGQPGFPGGPGDPSQQQQQPAANPYASMSPEDQKRFSPKFPAIKNLPTTIAFDRLPLIVKMPSTEAKNLGLVGALDASQGGAAPAQAGSFGLTVVPQAASPLADTIAGGTAELMILYHPNYPEQLTKLRRLLRDTIDKPARQVYVEGMVLEISSEGLKELGVQWDIRKGDQSWIIGTLVPQLPGGAAFNFIRNTALNISPTEITARINALVNSNQAEILSRPSVMTLDNRQATIRVGTDIPVATSKDASGGDANSSRVSFNFSYIPTGILMNIRPRISEDTQEISMLIDATVSATVPGQDLRVLDPATKITLASAPTIATRRVQTYARIRDNMPLIIGGLVSRNRVTSSSRVPVLGDIPYLGALFGQTSKNDTTREVIIVLTPSIVTENIRETKAQYPKDDARFDQFDTILFKEHYRIRAEDLVDSAHFRFNARFLRYRDAANRVIERAPALGERQPYAQFAGPRIPGEFIFVTGMMYRMLDRQKVGEDIKIQNLQYFEQVSATQQRPLSVGEALARYGDGKDPKSFFSKNPGKSLALTFRLARASSQLADMFTEPVPEVRLIDTADRNVWRQQLWDLNQPDERGLRYTMIINDPSDLRRLQLAMATQNTMLNNGGAAGMIFDRWLPGRMLHLQEVSPTWERVMSAQVAQFFFIGEYYYTYFIQEHTKALEDLDRALRTPEMKPLVEGVNLPPA
ncbi:type II secretion system protein GspD [Usitatibacter palustris]|uniref:Type 3 secretion system secretin n=1 Tax=Usitatibacter palustris TaxID=2732487 RepID=A0A6M4H9X4_9PROT|nr:type II secretion system protein GspD [Usitatibacter palustris]QJR16579.1 Type 3 secretion system secretin [Usitatibacter palustris]